MVSLPSDILLIWPTGPSILSGLISSFLVFSSIFVKIAFTLYLFHFYYCRWIFKFHIDQSKFDKNFSNYFYF